MKVVFLSGILAVAIGCLASAEPVTPVNPIEPGPCVYDADCVQAGYDYFITQPGTTFYVGEVPVSLTGIPDSLNYGADTIVQRVQNIDVPNTPGAQETVTTQMLELNLTGVDPSCPGGGSCTVTITLDPGNPSLGNLQFTQTANGEGTPEGTFTSFFDVFFDLSLTGANGPVPCDLNGDTTCPGEIPLTGQGFWTDDNGQYFIVGGQVIESYSGDVHVADQITPEPGTLLLFGSGLGLAVLVRRAFSARA